MDTMELQSGTKPEPLQPEPVTEVFLTKTQTAQDDLLKIIEYLAQRRALRQEEKVEKGEIEAAADLCSRPVAAMTDKERQRVWSTFDAFSHRIAPATVEGLREYHDHRSLPRGFRLFLGTLLIATILIQIYTLFGVQALSAIDARSSEQATVHEQINRMHEANPDLIRVETGNWEGVKKAHRDENVIYTHLWDRNAAINREKRTHYDALYQWNALWAAVVARLNGELPSEYWGCRCGNDEPCSKTCTSERQVMYGSESIARSIVIDLQILVLPVLYSALGAGVWLLRNHLAQVSERRQRVAQPGEISQRILLGAVLGGLVGALYMTEEIKGQLGSLPLLGLAFLVGYNVEIVFSALDRLIANIRHKGMRHDRS